jgi:glutamine cyclotransferase
MPTVAFYQTRRLIQTLALAASLLDAGFAVAAPVMSYKVVAKYPHSTDSYTEGFFYLDGLFYEGTGLNGHSAILVTQPKTGRFAKDVQAFGCMPSNQLQPIQIAQLHALADARCTRGIHPLR